MVYIENPEKFADKYKLKSSRFKNWDYSTLGFYFVTIKTLNNNNFFGKINNGKMELSKIGEIVKQCMIYIPKHFSTVHLDEYIIMPNHVHGILLVEAPDLAPLQNNRKITLINYSHSNHPDYFNRLNQKSKQLIPKIIQQFKSSVKRICNQNNFNFGWQPRFYDQIIQSEKELNNIRQYIKNNVKNWKNDL